MIWKKTEAGRAELKKRALVQSAVTWNLLTVIDGAKTEELLLKYSVGVTKHDFQTLRHLRLIEPQDAAEGLGSSASVSSDAQQFAVLLTREASWQFGLAGMTLIGEIGGARSLAELHRIAQLILTRVSATKGADAARAAQKRLFG